MRQSGACIACAACVAGACNAYSWYAPTCQWHNDPYECSSGHPHRLYNTVQSLTTAGKQLVRSSTGVGVARTGLAVNRCATRCLAPQSAHGSLSASCTCWKMHH